MKKDPWQRGERKIVMAKEKKAAKKAAPAPKAAPAKKVQRKRKKGARLIILPNARAMASGKSN
jgi:hypothetical protein